MICAEGIRLRAPEREDIPMFVDWLNDPAVRRGISVFLPMSIAKEEGWFEEMLKRPQIEQPMTIDIEEDGDWVPIGNTGFFDVNQTVRSAEIGIMIGNKDYWDKGFGTKTMQLMLRHGFETLNFNRIFLRVYEINPRAVRCYEKVGFVHEGSQRQAVYQEGEYSDLLMMSILKNEWKSDL